jgi:diguanylate cyclase (GGDEF)-like protein
MNPEFNILSFSALLIVFEILIINTYTVYVCSKKKTSLLGSAFFICVFIVAFTAVLIFIYLKNFSAVRFTGKGIIMLYGLLYIIPLKFMFDQSLKQTIIIISSSWLYTLLGFTFAVQTAYLFPVEKLVLSTSIFQTIFYALTLPFFIRFVKRTFIYIFKLIKKNMLNLLLVTCLSWFFIILLLNYGFIEGFSYRLKLLIFFAIIGIVILSYKMIFNLVSVNKKAITLSRITKFDTLTKLKNRESLYEDMNRKIDDSIPFNIVFIDLDDFKSVNDYFGHSTGDAYIIKFVNTANEVMKIKDSFYRLHGDEFVCLVESVKAEFFCRQLKYLRFVLKPENIAFRGLSLGCASFPTDGNTVSDLLHIADLKMYEQKSHSTC